MTFDKRRYYQQEDVVDRYDQWRFGSLGGRYVDDLERGIICRFLEGTARESRILDLPCGTGRLLRALSASGFRNLVGGDTSDAMLERARRACPSATLQAMDAFDSGSEAEAFDVVCSLRFLFHIEEVDRLFKEYNRILVPGGILAFDSIRWTPRGLIPPLDRALGGRLFCHSEMEITQALEAAGFRVLKMERALALPSLIYRYIPGWLLPLVNWYEQRGLRAAFTKTFVLAEKA